MNKKSLAEKAMDEVQQEVQSRLNSKTSFDHVEMFNAIFSEHIYKSGVVDNE